MSENTAFRAALIQMRSVRSIQPNLEFAEHLISEAAQNGAQYIQTPENTPLMELSSKHLFANIEPEENNTAVLHFIKLAEKLKIWLHVGGIPVKLEERLAANRSYLINPEGKICATYDKIHMFDVNLPGGESYCESKNFRPGEKAVLTNLPWGKMGLSICYDLRFPSLYRTLAKGGAQMLAVPAAFTEQTGKAHWHTLLRSRAIENGCYVLAAAQGGHHEMGRATFGHSVIISPWGEILAEAGKDPCWISAVIDVSKTRKIRQKLPSLEHDRNFELENQGWEDSQETS